jgi:TRAP-type C4-dicarboxylate transport system permease small subunit
MLKRFCDAVTALVAAASWVAFALLIGTVAMQVVARNVLGAPMIWTSDMALLLFTWLVFVGAALGLRRGAHYMVDMLPRHIPAVALAVEVLSILAGACVAWILGVHGWTLAQMRASGEIQSLGLSRFWIYLALPAAGWLMALYLLEMTVALIRAPFGQARAGGAAE